MGAPAGTPRPIVEKLNRELTEILDSPSIRQKIAAMGADVIGGTPEQFSDYLKTEIAKFARIVREGRLSVR
jgi:tripartite-type tricarboxylate transporter receptor subunit TctC